MRNYAVIGVGVLALVLTMRNAGYAESGSAARVGLTITSKLDRANVPFDPLFDFAKLIKQAGMSGVLDPNTIEVIDLTSGAPVLFAMGDGFHTGGKGRVEWVVHDPAHRNYEIRFQTTEKRTLVQPSTYTPRIGVGDLLRYNAGVPRPFALINTARLIDLTGDGRRDLVGTWNYFYRFGDPFSGVVCYPRVGDSEDFTFGDMIRLRYAEQPDSTEYHQFITREVYQHADFVDLNRDGRPDMAFRTWNAKEISLYLNSGKQDAGGMPVFVKQKGLPYPTRTYNNNLTIADIDSDGVLDYVTRHAFMRNLAPTGWPIEPAEKVSLQPGRLPCFFDVDGDGAVDSICAAGGRYWEPADNHLVWRKNLKTDPPTFAAAQPLTDIQDFWSPRAAAVTDGPWRGLVVQHNVFQELSFYQHIAKEDGAFQFQKIGRAQSLSAVMSLSDQAAPFVCDWDADGDLDILVGGGYGWPRIVINEGTTQRPAYAEAKLIEADGKPIRLLRNEILGPPAHGHNMGYVTPVYMDWDMDGLPDLIAPNETNRIFWYRNLGTREQPRFGKQQQIVVDGFPDSPESRKRSAVRAKDPKSKKGPYPNEKEQPFNWRVRGSYADLNGDGLIDLVTDNGASQQLTLFPRYRASDGTLHLRAGQVLTMAGGTAITDDAVQGGDNPRAGGHHFVIDWDGDEVLDIVYSVAGWHYKEGSLFLLKNIGTKTSPEFASPEPLLCYGKPVFVSRHGPQPWVGDMDGDSKPDILCYTDWSNYAFFSNAALTLKRRPEYEVGQAKGF